MKQDTYRFYKNFQSRTDLSKYEDNALLLYSLQIKYDIDDIHEVASTSLVDGPNDKKTDLIYIDPELNEAVIAQGFYSRKDRDEAPANKASDLNTAVSWLLTRQIDELPERLQSPAAELRRRIEDGEIRKITVWYSHNLPESANVQQELKSAETTLSSILSTYFTESKVEAASIEVGIKTLEDWYLGLTIPILVTDTIRIENAIGYEINGKGWTCFNSFLPADILYGLYKDNGAKLFSANVRDYLGSRKSDSNINNGIKSTAEIEPANFYVYNNGITALVNGYSFESKILTISGLSIVNGAQTTGALGSLKSSPSRDIKIPVRLIKCDNSDTIARIVKYNNSQNKINAPDFRSSDKVQSRLIKEFNSLDVIEYSSRRGGTIDTIKRNSNILPSVTVGQILAAFHEEPSIAYNEKSKIWESDKLYATFFNEQTTAKHIIYIYTLLKAIEEYKLCLVFKENRTQNEENTLALLRSRGAIILLITAISASIEELIGKKISNKFHLEFRANLSIEDGKSAWEPIIKIALSFSTHLKSGLTDGIKNQEKIKATIEGFKQFVSAVRSPNEVALNDFAGKLTF
jgi:hypothetical protein